MRTCDFCLRKLKIRTDLQALPYYHGSLQRPDAELLLKGADSRPRDFLVGMGCKAVVLFVHPSSLLPFRHAASRCQLSLLSRLQLRESGSVVGALVIDYVDDDGGVRHLLISEDSERKLYRLTLSKTAGWLSLEGLLVEIGVRRFVLAPFMRVYWRSGWAEKELRWAPRLLRSCAFCCAPYADSPLAHPLQTSLDPGTILPYLPHQRCAQRALL